MISAGKQLKFGVAFVLHGLTISQCWKRSAFDQLSVRYFRSNMAPSSFIGALLQFFIYSVAHLSSGELVPTKNVIVCYKPAFSSSPHFLDCAV